LGGRKNIWTVTNLFQISQKKDYFWGPDLTGVTQEKASETNLKVVVQKQFESNLLSR